MNRNRTDLMKPFLQMLYHGIRGLQTVRRQSAGPYQKLTYSTFLRLTKEIKGHILPYPVPQYLFYVVLGGYTYTVYLQKSGVNTELPYNLLDTRCTTNSPQTSYLSANNLRGERNIYLRQVLKLSKRMYKDLEKTTNKYHPHDFIIIKE